MKRFKWFKKSLFFRLIAPVGGIFFLAGVLWTGLLIWYGPAPDIPSFLYFCGLLLFVIALGLTGLVIAGAVIKPILQVSRTARRIADGKPLKERPVAGEDGIGRLSGTMARIADVLADKQQELLQEHSEYQNLFETVPCLITIQDRDLRLIRYNREFAQRFDPRQGDYCYSVYKGRTDKCENCPVEKTFQDGRSHTFEEAGFNRNGKPIRWLARTAPIKDENGEVVAAMEMSLDITLKRQLEERLEASQRRYQAIFSNIPNPVFVLEPESMEILDCNDSVKPVYSYEQAELRGKSFLDFFEPDERRDYAENIRNEIFLHRVKQFDKDGRTLFVDIRSSRTTYPEWEVILVTTSDITQQLETEQQLIQASKMTTLGEMATGIAHEINQPLSVMKTASSFMLKKYGSGATVDAGVLSNMLEKIDSNVDRATNIISHMRQFARKSELDLESVDVNGVLEMASDIFCEQLKVRGINVEWKFGPDLPRIQANPSRLEQVFVNILINARDAIEEKWGDQRVTSEEKTITITTSGQEEEVMVEICDTGKGIPDAVMARIFEPFYTTKPVGSGTGLGLSISYGIIRECGGTIKAVNRQSGGVCFTITFPVYEERPEE